jgi:ferric-dicitrate binding protein FerR (iron transport regulator)
MRQGADELAAWAGPQVRKTRSWAAPQLERTGVLVQEKLAPQVSEALTRAARKLDPEPAPRRRGLRGLLALGLATAAAAVAVMVMRKKTGSAASQPAEDGTDEPGTPEGSTPEDTASAEDSRVDANGHIRSTP